MTGDEATPLTEAACSLSVSRLAANVLIMDFDQLAADIGVAVVDHLIPHGLRGYYDHDARTIHLDETLAPVERRSTLAHELGHAVLGHTSNDPKCEVAATKWAVRELLPIQVLATAFREWGDNAQHAAAAIGVLPEDIEWRMSSLTDAEHYELLGRIQNA